MLKNIYQMVLASFLFTNEKIFTVTMCTKNLPDDQLYAYLSARKKDVIKHVLTQLTLSH